MNPLQFFTHPILPLRNWGKNRSSNKEKVSSVDSEIQALRKEMREMKIQMAMKKAEREAIRITNGYPY